MMTSEDIRQAKELNERMKILVKLRNSFTFCWPCDFEAASYYRDKINEVNAEIVKLLNKVCE